MSDNFTVCKKKMTQFCGHNAYAGSLGTFEPPNGDEAIEEDFIKKGTLVEFFDGFSDERVDFNTGSPHIGIVAGLKMTTGQVKVLMLPNHITRAGVYLHHVRPVAISRHSIVCQKLFKQGDRVVVVGPPLRGTVEPTLGSGVGAQWTDMKKQSMGKIFEIKTICSDDDIILNGTVGYFAPEYLRLATEDEKVQMQETKLHIGDFVVCERAHADAGSPGWISAMNNFIGCVGKVISADPNVTVEFKSADARFHYQPSWLRKATDAELSATQKFSNLFESLTAAEKAIPTLTKVVEGTLGKRKVSE